MNFQFADRVRDVGTSKVRESLNVPADYGLISFASGNPSDGTFPTQDVKEAAADALIHWEKTALQYAPSAGITDLRRKIADRMNGQFGTKYSPDNICVTTGSQQALDILGKLFINNGDAVLCEVPTQLSVMMAFPNYGVRFVEVASDDDGIIPEDVEAVLRSERNAKIIYITPDFMRPSGKSWSIERRKEFIDVVSGFDVLVVEDITNSEIRFEGENLPSVASFDKRGQVVTVGSFSRVFCPGLRIGWAAAAGGLFEGIRRLKLNSDLSSSSLDQCIFDSYMEKYDFPAHIKKIVDSHRVKRDLMFDTMRENFPKGAAEYQKPEGGTFFWINLANDVGAKKLLAKCIEQQVSFVPGEHFFPNGGGENMFRLSFSCIPIERIRSGVQRIVRAMGSLGIYPSTRVTINPKSYLENK